MDAPASSSCTACGRTQQQARKLIAVEGPALCDSCIKRYQLALANALDEETRSRSGTSMLIEAEEMALNLIDALETSRAEQAERELQEGNITALRNLRLVEEQGEPFPRSAREEELEDEDDEFADEADWEERPAEPPPEEAPPSPALDAEPSAPAERPAEAPAGLTVAFLAVSDAEAALATLDGKPRIAQAWSRAVESGVFAEAVVLSSDPRVLEAVAALGGKAWRTASHAQTDAQQAAELARARPELSWLVAVPVDAPPPVEVLRSLATAREDHDVQIATLVRPLSDEERRNPQVVKVVMGRNQDALYFSRADIPFERAEGAGFPHRYAHVPYFAYRREALLELAKLPPALSEETEQVSPLRALECGIKVRCLVTLSESLPPATESSETVNVTG